MFETGRTSSRDQIKKIRNCMNKIGMISDAIARCNFCGKQVETQGFCVNMYTVYFDIFWKAIAHQSPISALSNLPQMRGLLRFLESKYKLAIAVADKSSLCYPFSVCFPVSESEDVSKLALV